MLLFLRRRHLSTSASAGLRILLRKRPVANQPVTMDCFDLRKGGCGPPAPVCAAGALGSSSADMLYCRTLMVSVDPFLRCRFNEATGVDYTSPYDLAAPITSAGIGQVLACGSHARLQGFRAGDLVLQPFDAWPWATATSVPASSVSQIPPLLGMLVRPSALLGAAGQPGLTAYVGVDRVAKPNSEETVIVSGAAGAVGSIVAQLCRRRGARVVGLCGSEQKARWLVDAGIVDRAINYKGGDEMVKALREERAQVYWDNVGGSTSDLVIMNALLEDARIVVCGQIAMYDTDEEYPPPLKGEVLDHATRLGITRERYLVLDHREGFAGALAEIFRMVAADELVCRETIWSGGVGSAPAAFVEMMGGANAGKALVASDPDSRFPPSISWRAAEVARRLMPPALRGWLAAHFATEARMAAALGL